MYVDGETLNKTFAEKDQVIFREGDLGEAVYLVESGSIGIFKTVEGEEIQLATMKEGELFGEMAIIYGSDRMAHAVALEDSVIVTLPRAGLEAMLAKQEPLVKTLIQILVDNLRNVHEVYMKRPRSIHDYFNAIGFHINGLAGNLKAHPDADPSGEGLRKLRLIEDQIEVLSEQFKTYQDQRGDVLDPSGEGLP